MVCNIALSLTLASIVALGQAQVNPNWAQDGELWYDTVKSGPEIELVHLYYDQFPTGIAVSKTGRKFSNYPPGLDANNTNDGSNNKYTIAELLPNNRERAWPSAEINHPPGGSINYTTYPPTGANHATHIIGSQSIIIDSADRAWILDTGRALTPDGTLAPATPGGPKLLGVDLATDRVFQTIVFPPDVAYPDSYLNDVRVDLRPARSPSGRGVAYITDSSVEGRNGIVVVDLGSGESWRHLDGNPAVRPEGQNVLYLWGIPIYAWQPSARDSTHVPFGSDGIALSPSGDTLYWKIVGGRGLFAIPTRHLRDRGAHSELRAQAAVVHLGQTGVSDGLETDSCGRVYHGNMEQNAVGFYDPRHGTDVVWVRDPRINWVDTFSVAEDGYLYFTNNQLVFGSGLYPGEDRRRKPYSLFRVKLPDGATKVIPGGDGSEGGNATSVRGRGETAREEHMRSDKR